MVARSSVARAGRLDLPGDAALPAPPAPRGTPPARPCPVQVVTFMEKKGSRGYPVGVLSISAWLKARGHRDVAYMEFDLFARVRNGRLERSRHALPCTAGIPDERVAWLVARAPRVLLLGPVFTWSLPHVLAFARHVRALLPGTWIVAGGPHFGKDMAGDAALLAANPAIDGVVVGDGEETTCDLVDRIAATVPDTPQAPPRPAPATAAPPSVVLAGIPGLLVAGAPFQPRRPLDLATADRMPDYDLLGTNPFLFHGYSLARRKNPVSWNNRRFFYQDRHPAMPFAYLIGSRGCPYDCIFCAGGRPVAGGNGQAPAKAAPAKAAPARPAPARRVRTTAAILAEIEHLHRTRGITKFFFTDPLFMAPGKRDAARVDGLFAGTIDLARRLGTAFSFILELRIDVVNAMPVASLAGMLRAGVRVINMGFEKATDEGLRIFHKNITTADQARAVRKIRAVARSLGITVLVVGTFVIGGPNESIVESFTTLLHPVRLGIDTFRLFPLQVFAGTRIHRYLACTGGLAGPTRPGEVPVYARSANHRRILELIRRAGDVLEALLFLLRGACRPARGRRA